MVTNALVRNMAHEQVAYAGHICAVFLVVSCARNILGGYT